MPYVMRPIPPDLDASLHARWCALEERIKANDQMETELQQAALAYGQQVGISLESIVSSRLQSLIDVLLPFDGGPEVQDKRLQIDERLHAGVTEFLGSAKSSVIKQLIAAGANIPKPLLDQMAAQQGLGPNAKGLLRG